jgi:hypothetical protein
MSEIKEWDFYLSSAQLWPSFKNDPLRRLAFIKHKKQMSWTNLGIAMGVHPVRENAKPWIILTITQSRNGFNENKRTDRSEAVSTRVLCEVSQNSS